MIWASLAVRNKPSPPFDPSSGLRHRWCPSALSWALVLVEFLTVSQSQWANDMDDVLEIGSQIFGLEIKRSGEAYKGREETKRKSICGHNPLCPVAHITGSFRKFENIGHRWMQFDRRNIGPKWGSLIINRKVVTKDKVIHLKLVKKFSSVLSYAMGCSRFGFHPCSSMNSPVNNCIHRSKTEI